MPKFKPGESGNPKGRPHGRADRRGALRELIVPHVETVVARVVEAALAGDMAAARLLLERSIPALRPCTEAISMRTSRTTDVAHQGRELLAAMLSGVLTPTQATDALSALASVAKLIEVSELERRINELERARGTPP